jgi:S-formylglutathione hydrolase FrmB
LILLLPRSMSSIFPANGLFGAITNMLNYYITCLFLLASLSLQAATIEVVQIPSAKMDTGIPATVILPDSYSNNQSQLPVLYLLHGAGGSHVGWNAQTRIAELADEYEMMIVCPDGGVTSWYFDSPIDPTYQYETHVAEECVQFVDEHYRTRADRSGRAIAGLSMGGHGALFLAIRHRDTFSTSIVMSGGVDIRPFPNAWEIAKRIGSMSEYPQNWERYSVINQAKQLKDGDLNIVIDCGRDDFFIGVNRALHQQLLEDGISHLYEEHAGAHNWDYWKASIERQIPYVATQFKAAREVSGH